MNTKLTSREEREEIEMLLPWYAVGTLQRDEVMRVESYLQDHPEMRDQLALIAEETEETIGVNEALGTPSPGALDRLMERVQQQGPEARIGARQGLWQRIVEQFGALSPGVAAFGTAAAVVIICIQAIALGVVLSDDQGPFQTVSEDETRVEVGTVALVSFAENATVEQVSGLLATSGATIVDGPKPGGVYRIRLSEAVLPDAERDAALERLRASPLVKFAAPAS